MMNKFFTKPLFYLSLLFTLSLPVFSKTDQTLKREKTTDSISSPVSAEGTAMRAIQDLEKKMEDFETDPNLSAQARKKNAAIKHEVITGIFNIRELCALSLDKHWGGLSDDQKNGFVDLMTRLLEKRGILSKEQSQVQGKSYTVRYVTEKSLDRADRSEVKTEVEIPKENLKVMIDYRLLKAEQKNWRIFDVVLDGQSLMENYRYHFDSTIQKHGFNELVSRLQKKLNEIE